MSPTLYELTNENSKYFFQNTKMNVVLFTEEEEEIKMMEKVSKQKDFEEFNFFYSLSSQETDFSIEIFLKFGVPTIPALILTNENLKKKFVLQEDITVDSIVNFLKEYKKNKLKKFLKSSERPSNDKHEDFSENLTYVVSDSFDELIKEKKKEILFALVDESETSKKGLIPIISKIANYFKENNINIEVSMMDTEENDVDESFCGHVHPPSVSFISLEKKFIPYKQKGRGSELIQFIQKSTTQTFNVDKLKEMFIKEEEIIDEERKSMILISEISSLLNYFKNKKDVEETVFNLENSLKESNLNGIKKEYKNLLNLTSFQIENAKQMKSKELEKYMKHLIDIQSIEGYEKVLKSKSNIFFLFVDEREKEYRDIVSFLSSLSEKYSEIQFVKIDVNKNIEISIMNQIEAIPTFQMIKNQKKIFEIKGGSETEIKKKIEQYFIHN
jgi:hypothetical protein